MIFRGAYGGEDMIKAIRDSTGARTPTEPIKEEIRAEIRPGDVVRVTGYHEVDFKKFLDCTARVEAIYDYRGETVVTMRSQIGGHNFTLPIWCIKPMELD